MAKPITVPLHYAAHGRTGDKGSRSNISVIAYRPELFRLLLEQVTEAAVAGVFADRRPSAVRRYLLPKLHAMNFVLDDVLDGGVNNALNLDTHGKALSFLLLELPLEVPASQVHLLEGVAATDHFVTQRGESHEIEEPVLAGLRAAWRGVTGRARRGAKLS